MLNARTTGDRIRWLRLTRHLTQREIAEKLGIRRETVAQWERGATTPDSKTLSWLASYFQVSLDYLIEGKEPVRLTHKVPIVGQIRCLPVLRAENIIGETEVPADMVADGRYWQMIVRDDSMSGAGLKAGHKILVREQSQVKYGEIALVKLGENVMIRKVYATNGGHLLIPANPEFTEIKAAKGEMTLLGRVRIVWFEV